MRIVINGDFAIGDQGEGEGGLDDDEEGHVDEEGHDDPGEGEDDDRQSHPREKGGHAVKRDAHHLQYHKASGKEANSQIPHCQFQNQASSRYFHRIVLMIKTTLNRRPLLI